MANALENLRVEVAKQKDVNRSVATLIQGLVARLEQAVAANSITSDGNAIMQELANDLKSHGEQLAAAVSENTPADPAKIEAAKAEEAKKAEAAAGKPASGDLTGPGPTI